MILAVLAPGAAPLKAGQADLILRGGRVFIAPGRYAQAVAVQGHRILAVGSDDEISRFAGKGARVIDLRGRAVTAGFEDAHAHFLSGALALDQAQLAGSTSAAVVQDRLRQWLSAHPKAPWVLGQGWDHTAFPGRKYPAREDLDAVTGGLPAALEHDDGHLLWVNSEALKRAGIDKNTPDPPNGKILRGERGEPNGILLESAMDLVEKVLPKPDKAEIKEALRRGLALARSNGVTAIQGMLNGDPQAQLEAWRDLSRSGEVTLRYFVWGEIEKPAEFSALRRRFKSLPADRFVLGGLKGFVDGVISARTAALLEPYSDSPDVLGEPNYSSATLAGLVASAHAAGFQAVLHAIGDRAVRMALDACESSLKAKAPALPMGLPPCKIEHIEVIAPADLPRFKTLGAVASMQPSHMTYDREDQNYNPERLGPRCRHAFAWRSMEQSGALLAFGTDWPVMPLHPRAGLFAAATRKHFNLKPDGGWIPEEAVSLEAAVRHYTLDSAKAAGWGDRLGSIEPGKLADLAVWDRDILSAPPEELLKSEVDLTVFDGKVVFERRP